MEMNFLRLTCFNLVNCSSRQSFFAFACVHFLKNAETLSSRLSSASEKGNPIIIKTIKHNFCKKLCTTSYTFKYLPYEKRFTNKQCFFSFFLVKV